MDETARLLFVDDEENILKSLRRFITDEDSEAKEELRKGDDCGPRGAQRHRPVAARLRRIS